MARPKKRPPKRPLPLGTDNGADAVPAPLGEVVQDRYRTYALSVIGSRALPDVRDGLKPVQRRILTTMWRQGLRADGRFRKCAKVVGDVMGGYHPHGDAAIYEALVRMAQPFASRLPLIEGAGNFGSLDGDPAAAMRYTECRLAEAAEDVLGEIGLDTVPHRPTYDGTRTEPVVLPTRLPLLLVNGSTGIAVGVATSIPPHNLFEVVRALIRLLDDPSLGSRELAETVRGPDFPTGGEILDPPERLAEIYEEGKGSVRVRGTVEDHGTRRHIRTLFITSVPYGVNKAQLVQRLGEIVADRSLPALLDVSDLSTDDVQIRLEVRKDVDKDKILAFLYKRTPLQSSVPVDLTCLRFDRSEGGIPERVGLRTLLQDFLGFRRDVVRRRLEDERRKLDGRLHILEGFKRVFDALDRILEIVRASDGKADAARKIMAELPLDREQTEAVLELKIYRLARLEIQVILEEMKDRKKRLREVKRLLGSEEAITGLIREELAEIRDRPWIEQERRTEFPESAEVAEFAEEDFILAEDTTVVLTRDGWIKRQREVKELDKLRLREGDEVLALEAASTRAPFILFSSLGTAFTARIADVAATTGHGDPVQKMFTLRDGERVVSLLGLDSRGLDGALTAPGSRVPERHAIALTKSGYALRFSLEDFLQPSKRNGRRFARLKEGDEIIGTVLTTGEDTLILATRDGRALLCDVEEINVLSGAGLGVKAINLGPGDRVIGFRVSRRKEPLVAVTTGGGTRLIARGDKFKVGARGRRGQLVNKAGFEKVKHEVALPRPLKGPP